MGLFDRSKKAKKPAADPPPTSPPPASAPAPAPHNPSSGPSSASSVPCRPPPWPQHGSPPPSYFQPVGYLPSPPGWTGGNHLQSPYPYPAPAPPIVVNQHYYLGPPPALPPPSPPGLHTSSGPLGKLNLGSMVNLATDALPGNLPRLFDDRLPAWQSCSTQLLNQSAALVDQISSRFNEIMTHIDRGIYNGDEGELFYYQPPSSQTQSQPQPQPPSSPPAPDRLDRSLGLKVGKKAQPAKGHTKDHPKGQTTAVAATVISGSYFAKVDLYANSRLPLNLPPLKLYIPTYPLLCLAAQYSERVYQQPQGAETDAHVDADWRTGTKAMVVKSVPMDYMNVIVFAVRGTATFMDWAVNLNMSPASPAGFLDDDGNFCHAGFLSVARKMIRPVAARLRQLLEEDPSRASYSLLITGHSAGGAVASLLYSHMLATTKAASSELNALTGCFKRIHCVTFGTPPVSLLPLTKPDRLALKKSLFLSFVNEGDPVARADKAYVKSLLELFAAPAPAMEPLAGITKGSKSAASSSQTLVGSGKGPRKEKSKASLASSKSGKPSGSSKAASSSKAYNFKPVSWKVPPSTLSSAGRIVVLRSGKPGARLTGKKTVEERLNEGVVAQVATDEQLRGVIWGDPVCHVMRLYAGRIETLAVGAVTAKGH